MFFSDLLQSPQQRRDYERICGDFAAFVKDCMTCLLESYKAVHEAVIKINEPHNVTVVLLVRHVIESLDGVSVLVAQGCSEPCQPLLRSALEATLGVLYILQHDTKRRALAYQVAHAHKKIKLYQRADPTTPAGQDFRKSLHGDLCEDVFNRLPIVNYPKLIDNLKKMLETPTFQPVEAEWQKLKKERKGEPEWFSLFGGPQNVRELAIRVKWLGMYEFLYRQWSNETHAGRAMEAVGSKDGVPVMRPIRLRRGDRATCLFKDCDVVIKGWTDARISWPRCLPVGTKGHPSLLVDEELARAVRHESAAALRHWWGVSALVVWKWRRVLGVDRINCEGTTRLMRAASELGAAQVRGKELPPEQVEQRRRTALELNLGQYLRPGYNLDPWWSRRELALLGTDDDEVIAARIGRTPNAVGVMRRRRKVPKFRDRRRG
jgi:hypothetical protein